MFNPISFGGNQAIGISNTLGKSLLEITRRNGPETWQGTTLYNSNSNSSKFALKNKAEIEVASANITGSIVVKLNFEGGGLSPVEYDKNVTFNNANQLVTLTYDTSNKLNSQYTTVSIFFDFGLTTRSGRYYVGDIILSN